MTIIVRSKSFPWSPRSLREKTMLIVVCAVLACGCCWPPGRPDDAFPATMVFEGLGLPDVLLQRNGSVAGEPAASGNDTAAAGDLNGALMTMNFHR